VKRIQGRRGLFAGSICESTTGTTDDDLREWWEATSEKMIITLYCPDCVSWSLLNVLVMSRSMLERYIEDERLLPSRAVDIYGLA
jgi:hypothetical protein